MSWVKRQELFENLNPLLKKYKYDGPQPPSYIPPNKRRTIQRYMDRSSYNPGSYGKCSTTFLSYFQFDFGSSGRRGGSPHYEGRSRDAAGERH